MKNEEFRFGKDRIISIWIYHGTALLFLLIFLLMIFTDPPGSFNIVNYGMGLVILCLLFVPHSYLYYNHLKYEKGTVIVLTADQMTITKHGFSKTFMLDDIAEVQQYEAFRTPWTIIVKWKIIGKYEDETISSIIFPRTRAWQVFGKKINRVSSLMPTLP